MSAVVDTAAAPVRANRAAERRAARLAEAVAVAERSGLTVHHVKPLDKREVAALTHALLSRLRDLDPASHAYSKVRGSLVELNLSLVHYVARGFARRREIYDDLLQTGVVGLIKAIDAFDTERGSEFASYALPTISGEIKRFFRDTSWTVHVPRGQQERFLAVTRGSDRMQQELGREPKPDELAERLGMTVAEVNDGREASRAYLVDSLDAPPGGDPGNVQDRAPLSERLGYDDPEIDLVDFRESVKPLLGALPEREQLLLELRFWQDLPQREIGDRLGVSQMHVSRLLAATLSRLRRQLENDAPRRRR
ncbi:SigB/SigF/SigG family RNA polymerase sigma factor [Yinghuangia seranimata]|uniref:SigB/SigF/SigG family RNA polymerase sigma factor n=1 Tax=Yinghuangia seranimata TaxID=408067 RepID=UPI00248B8E24|nr:SigB/SigF/SigG family RNA polymerase sigma factor [Yinghuangia seranimata]MDI2130918.1 SigB/SigF/SigG family RNA polymerase sigma factor [Yinghuangia seranimata]